jgi:hypothetical protein
MSQGNPVAKPMFYSYKIRLKYIFPSKIKFLFIRTKISYVLLNFLMRNACPSVLSSIIYKLRK